MKLSIEAYGNSDADNGTYGARCDEPMCEFWRLPKDAQHPRGDFDMPSVAHVYGKPIVGSEAFTADSEEKGLAYPGDMKAQGDWAFAMGINRLVLCLYAMQPWPNIRPGMALGPSGFIMSGPRHGGTNRDRGMNISPGANICSSRAFGSPTFAT